MEGFRHKRKNYNEASPTKSKNLSKEKINDRLADNEIIDAEFEEIK